MQRFQHIDALAFPMDRPNVDTDQILPARFLQKPRNGGFGQYLFHDLRFAPDGSQYLGFLLNQEAYRESRVVVGSENFGCGSSRENAVWALYDYGFRVAIAPSFGDIFANNCLKNGVLPIRLPREVVSRLLVQIEQRQGLKVDVDLASQKVTLPDGSVHTFDVDPFAKHCLLNGLDELDYTLSHTDEIVAFERRYGRGFD
ncbi:MAG: 3-isopropylmalate dehydratase small subunit [Ancalomicrobiaceae bacterium]|nr:3-isopropylmalate dehydratase small subunit [Ancalomicrobiaceae bacterium]